jgi:hypothetical protein
MADYERAEYELVKRMPPEDEPEGPPPA